ncbi:neuropeptide-like 2 [Drosophila miranda]|uniref:neuropeptide-like 2 n=1 Tax=Drosophila miranda TaxID=7229 RepID=UPI0007E6DDA4|nr:neuropeptide-like 2 [Drosophila miranda]
MAKIALIFFLFALFAVCMCARLPREEPTKPVEAQLNDLLAKFKDFFNEDSVKDFQDKAKAAAEEGLAAFQKFSNTVNEQIQKAPKP